MIHNFRFVNENENNDRRNRKWRRQGGGDADPVHCPGVVEGLVVLGGGRVRVLGVAGSVGRLVPAIWDPGPDPERIRS